MKAALHRTIRNVRHSFANPSYRSHQKALCELGTGGVVVITFAVGAGIVLGENVAPSVQEAFTTLLAKRIPGEAVVANRTGKPVKVVRAAAERLKQAQGVPANQMLM
jgi:hypothetical protein